MKEMIEKIKLIKVRLLILLAIILSIKLALMFWKEIEYKPIVMIYGLSAGLYLPVTLTILLFMTQTKKSNQEQKEND